MRSWHASEKKQELSDRQRRKSVIVRELLSEPREKLKEPRRRPQDVRNALPSKIRKVMMRTELMKMAKTRTSTADHPEIERAEKKRLRWSTERKVKRASRPAR